MLRSASLVAFAPATDLARTRDFYETVLGLELVDENPYACVFSSGEGTLRIVPVEAHVPTGYTVVGWVVPDIDATVQALGDAGVAITRYEGMGQNEVGIWTTPGGDRVAWFTDPEGNVLSVTQLPS